MPELPINELVIKHLRQELNDAENQQLNNWLELSEKNRLLFKQLTDKKWIANELEEFYRFDEDAGWEKIRQGYPMQAPVISIAKKQNWWRVAAAAVIFLLLGTASYFIFFNRAASNDIASEKPNVIQDVAPPNSANAVLTLGNGQKIILDSVGNGAMATEGNANITKLADGQIAYDKAADNVAEVTYNTLSVPRGSRLVSLQLADGSKIWLNSESSLRYPTVFTGNERKVEITGEAYFEVAHISSGESAGQKQAMPFKVQLGDGTEIEVLGTHFNINAYSDEATINTTLLEGSVMVKKGGLIKKLVPGQQARVNEEDMEIVNDVNLEQVVAWKNGLFNFNRESIQAAMRQVSRWYDVEVVYEKGIPDNRLIGRMQRNLTLSQIIEGLEDPDVHFRIEGRKLIVSP